MFGVPKHSPPNEAAGLGGGRSGVGHCAFGRSERLEVNGMWLKIMEVNRVCMMMIVFWWWHSMIFLMIYVYWRYKHDMWNIMEYSEDPLNHDADKCLIRCRCILLGFTIWPVGLSEQGKTPRFTGESWLSLFELPFISIYHHHHIYIYYNIASSKVWDARAYVDESWTSTTTRSRGGRSRAAMVAEARRKIDKNKVFHMGIP